MSVPVSMNDSKQFIFSPIPWVLVDAVAGEVQKAVQLTATVFSVHFLLSQACMIRATPSGLQWPFDLAAGKPSNKRGGGGESQTPFFGPLPKPQGTAF